MKGDLLADLRAAFRQRAARDRVILIQSLEAGDISQIEWIAHRLAGSAGMFGFSDVAEAALAIDDGFAAGRGLDANAAARLVSELEALA